MSANANSSSDHEDRLNEIVASYIQAREEQGPQDQSDWIARYPGFGQQLAAFFADQDELEKHARPHHVAPPTASVPSTIDYTPTDAEVPALDLRVGIRPTSAQRAQVTPGKVLAGQHDIIAVNAGGMGEVYIAKCLNSLQRGIDLTVAIKTVAEFASWREKRLRKAALPDRGDYDYLVERFRREAKTWVRLRRHQNIVYALAVVDIGGKPHLVMEFANGGDLASWIAAGRLDVQLATNYALQFCDGMNHAIEHGGIVHRDIKPSNVMIHNGNVVKVTDFGLSKSIDHLADLDHSSNCTPPSDLSILGAGTLAYMAPEQFESISNADTRSDIFSFGAMFFEMLTGKALFPATTAMESLMLRREQLRLAHEINPLVPVTLSSIVQRCVAWYPEDRFPSFVELRSAIHSAYSDMPGSSSISRDASEVPADVQAVGESYSMFSLGEYEQCVRIVDDVLQQHPLSDNSPVVDLLINKGAALFRLRRFDASRDCLDRALQLHPENALAWANLSQAQNELGESTTALASAQRAIEIDSELSDSWFALGRVHESSECWDEAAKSYDYCCRLNPHQSSYQLQLGTALFELGRSRADALAHLQIATEIDPDNALAWCRLSACLSEMNCGAESLAAIDRALTINAENSLAWTARGMILWEHFANSPAARECLERALDIDPNNAHAAGLWRRIPAP